MIVNHPWNLGLNKGEQSYEQEWVILKNGFKSHEQQWIHIEAPISIKWENFKTKHYIIDKICKLTKCDDQVKSRIAQIS